MPSQLGLNGLRPAHELNLYLKVTRCPDRTMDGHVGSMVAVALPIGMSFVQFDTALTPIIIAAILIVAQQAVGNLLEPRMIGQRLGVSPLIILLSLAFWGFLWGVPGMILSAPLAVSIKIVLENIEQTRPIARLCSANCSASAGLCSDNIACARLLRQAASI